MYLLYSKNTHFFTFTFFKFVLLNLKFSIKAWESLILPLLSLFSGFVIIIVVVVVVIWIFIRLFIRKKMVPNCCTVFDLEMTWKAHGDVEG